MSGLLKKSIQLSLILIAFYSIGVVVAQESVSNSISSVNLSFSPSSPRAGDSVVFTVSSELLDLSSSKIVWYVDGVVRRESTSKSIVIKTKNTDEKINVRVVVGTSDGIIKETSKDLSLAGIDLVIEPMSYTLPFYKGKPYFVAEGKVKIIALPDIMVSGIKIPAKNLNFTWSRDNNVLADNSGKGQNSIVVNSIIPIRDINVAVQITDESGNILVETSKLIVKNDPKILFFENSPLYGILYNKAIFGDYFLGNKEELSIVAKPFSFDFLTDSSQNSDYSWYVNDGYVSPAGKTNEIIMRQATTTQKGIASISLDLKNINKINQYASGGFSVLFGE